ncbi:MAG: hypothetical protein J0M28_12005 [Thauera sp.]|nr:hypothetical protein [Thauera sp.]
MSEQDKLLAVIEELRAEVRSLVARVAELEARQAHAGAPAPAAAPPAPADTVSEEEMLAISAAIAAFLGVRAKIRQVRLVHSATWAQVGRVHIQASHRVH